MNRNQKIVSVIVSVVLVGMLLFPPFQKIDYAGRTQNIGYQLIFKSYNGTINTSQWSIQMFVFGFVGVIAWYFFKKNS
jgi:hypothetical protein